MKWFLTIFVSLITLSGITQLASKEFAVIDSQVKEIPFSMPGELSKEITKNCTTDLEKTRAIFRWITENIAYRTRATTRKRKLKPGTYQEPPDSVELKPLDERVAEDVLV